MLEKQANCCGMWVLAIHNPSQFPKISDQLWANCERLLDYGQPWRPDDVVTKKLKNEKGLLREALQMIMDDAVKRGIVEFEATDSHDLKIEYAYRLLVHDKEIAPLPKGQETLPKIRHRLAMWVTHKLPADHQLLN